SVELFIHWRSARRSLLISLQAAQMKPAVYIYDLAGGIVKQSIGNGPDGAGHVGGLAHAPLGHQTGRDLLFVGALHCGNHIRTDDSWPDLEYLDSAGRQAL